MAGKKKTKPEKLTISIPSSSMSEQAMGNLRAMVKTKEALISSDRNLRLANDKAQDLSIKRLTKNAPSVRAMFEEYGTEE